MDKEILEEIKNVVRGLNDISCVDCKSFNNFFGVCNENRTCDETIVDAVSLLRHFEKHHNKYRWHDLRKNPDDLPTEYTRNFECVILWFDGDITVSLRNATYISDCAIGKSRGSHNDVIAWREFDFEQEDF